VLGDDFQTELRDGTVHDLFGDAGLLQAERLLLGLQPVRAQLQDAWNDAGFLPAAARIRKNTDENSALCWVSGCGAASVHMDRVHPAWVRNFITQCFQIQVLGNGSINNSIKKNQCVSKFLEVHATYFLKVFQ